VLHVTHQGKMHNTTLGRCNLLFRTLVDNGKTFKDEDLISFKGPLKVDNAESESVLVFKFRPRFAQMKPVNIGKRAIHTEKGIFDAVPLLPALPKPTCPVTNSESIEMQLPSKSVEKTPESARKRAQTVSHDFRNSRLLDDGDGEDEEDTREIPDKEEPSTSTPRKEETPEEKPQERIPVGGLKKTPVSHVVDDLIQFTPPNSRRRAASASQTTQQQVNPFATNFPQAQPAIAMPTFGGPSLGLQAFPQQPSYGQQQGGFPQLAFPAQIYSPAFAQNQQPTFNPFAQPQPLFPAQFPAAQPQNSSAPTFNPFAPAQTPPVANPFASQSPQNGGSFL